MPFLMFFRISKTQIRAQGPKVPTTFCSECSLFHSAPDRLRIHHTRQLGRLEFDALSGTVEKHFRIGQASAIIETIDLTVPQATHIS